jgi:hypothetical protein
VADLNPGLYQRGCDKLGAMTVLGPSLAAHQRNGVASPPCSLQSRDSLSKSWAAFASAIVHAPIVVIAAGIIRPAAQLVSHEEVADAVDSD